MRTVIAAAADAFGNPANRFQYLTGPRSLIVRALVEGRLTEHFSLEANVLHRPMKLTVIYTKLLPDGANRVYASRLTAVRTWEFALMLKYALSASRFTGRI